MEIDKTADKRAAEAYLLAAGHLLSGWPESWSAERLALALVTEGCKDQKKIKLWAILKDDEEEDRYLWTESLISSLAEDIYGFGQA